MRKPFRDAFKLAMILSVVLYCGCGPVLAEQYYDVGLKCFQSKKYAEAARYFDQAVKNAPWESSAYYYGALSYHYLGNFKKAAELYGECSERFPGTLACNQSVAALKVVDPDYFKRKKETRTSAASSKEKSVPTTSGIAQDKGTVEGMEQTRLFFRLNDRDKVIDVRINGRTTRAILDTAGESTSFSRQQLTSLGLSPDKSATEFKAEVALGGVVRKNFPVTVEDTGLPARIGTSFLDAFTVDVNDSAKTVDIRRKSASSGTTTGAAAVSFVREGKSIVVTGEINGHGTQMIFDPDATGEVSLTTQQAKNLGLRIDDAEIEHKNISELPARGEPGWVDPTEDKLVTRTMSLRMKFGPIERLGVSSKVTEQGPKKPTFGPDFISQGGYKYDINYKTSRITLTRK